MEETKRTIAANLRQAIKLKGVKQTEIAAFLGVSKSAVSHWLSGDNSIEIDTLAKLCDYLGITLNQIAGLEALDEKLIVNRREYILIKMFRELNANEQDRIEAMIKYDWMAKKEKEKRESAIS